MENITNQVEKNVCDVAIELIKARSEFLRNVVAYSDMESAKAKIASGYTSNLNGEICTCLEIINGEPFDDTELEEYDVQEETP